MSTHLDMAQLIALRDGDRSEPGMADTQLHFGRCLTCQAELERLHQRTARLRALPRLEPAINRFPAVRELVQVDRRQRHWRGVATIGIAAAALLVFGAIGRDLVKPARLDAADQLQSTIHESQLLEQKLHSLTPDARVIDGRTAVVVIQLEDRIASLDAQLAQTDQATARGRTGTELNLWRQRVGLMHALVDVHMTNATNVGL
ncbi:MAG TPA: hypothetical protein VGM77_05325 [Gemmatimonadales bacterium]|jgi:hypothetical protein